MEELDKKLREIAVVLFQIPESSYSDDFSLGSSKLWDSLGHMNFIVEIENAFSVRFESDEIPELKSIREIKLAIRGKLN